jgi:hypothetical protein
VNINNIKAVAAKITINVKKIFLKISSRSIRSQMPKMANTVKTSISTTRKYDTIFLIDVSIVVDLVSKILGGSDM